MDATKIKGALTLKFDAWYDLDSSYDYAAVRVYRQGSNTALHTFNLPKTGCPGGCLKQLHKDLTYKLDKVAGLRIRLRFYLVSNNSGNKGAGVFIDNVRINLAPDTPEVCTDGKDNDGDGLKDCADPDCKTQSACQEKCGDGKDNDLDDKIDCDDPDCGNSLECAETLYQSAFNCGSGGWSHAQKWTQTGVKWAVDATPNNPKPHSASCSLNFNNGKNYCGRNNCSTNDASSTNQSVGVAMLNAPIDATKYKSLWLTFWEYQGVNTGTYNKYDRLYLQMSTSKFAGCCGAVNQCSGSTGSEYCSSTSGGHLTRTYSLSRTSANTNKWYKRTVALTSGTYAFAGRKFQVRFRFNSRYGRNKTGAGIFIDDIKVVGFKK